MLLFFIASNVPCTKLLRRRAFGKGRKCKRSFRLFVCFSFGWKEERGLLKPGTRDPGSAGIGWDPVPGFSIWHNWIPGPRFWCYRVYWYYLFLASGYKLLRRDVYCYRHCSEIGLLTSIEKLLKFIKILQVFKTIIYNIIIIYNIYIYILYNILVNLTRDRVPASPSRSQPIPGFSSPPIWDN